VLRPFIGYALGRRFIGHVECRGERLADVLNRADSIAIRDAFVESYDDDTVVNLGDGQVERAILYAVETTADRDDGPHKGRTVRHRLQVQLGPYSALGLLHAGPGQLPLPYLTSHGPMIPLTEATLGFACRGTLVLRDVGTLIVNRSLMDWVRAGDDEAAFFPGVPVVHDHA
jgi:hypothetical protein